MDSGLATYITYNPCSVSLETRVEDLLRIVEDLAMQDVPVVDEGQRLIGIVPEIGIVGVAREFKQFKDEGTQRSAATVAQIFTSEVVTVNPAASPGQALRLLMENHIQSLPVLDSGRLVGIVTKNDFLREFSYGEMTSAKEPVSDFLSPPADPLDPDATVEGALKAMDKSHADHLAVVQGGCPVGIISRREITDLGPPGSQHHGNLAPHTSILKFLRKTPAFRPGQRMNEAAVIMLEQDLSALAVTNQANRFLGMITKDEILKVMLRGLKK